MKGAIPEYVNTQILYTERIELSPPHPPPPLAKFVGIKGGGDLVRDRRPKAKSGSKRGAGLSARQAA